MVHDEVGASGGGGREGHDDGDGETDHAADRGGGGVQGQTLVEQGRDEPTKVHPLVVVHDFENHSHESHHGRHVRACHLVGRHLLAPLHLRGARIDHGHGRACLESPGEPAQDGYPDRLRLRQMDLQH